MRFLNILSKLGRFLISKFFLINATVALLIALTAVAMSDYMLKSYTRHGESISVPDLRELSLDESINRLKSLNLRYHIADSAYNMDLPPGTVLNQSPTAYSNVKEYRKIYLTINATNPPSVRVPNLIDKSLRQANIELTTFGLKIGELIYKPDLAQNAVLRMMLKGEEIEPGDEVPQGSVIDLILGDGLGNTTIEVPDLIGLTYDEARWLLLASSLNLGSVSWLPEITDSTTAMISRQFPPPGEDAFINIGESISIFVEQEIPDSLRTGWQSLYLMDDIDEFYPMPPPDIPYFDDFSTEENDTD